MSWLRGKLFPELDKALFELKAGEVCSELESELGFHILRCDAISEAGVLGYEQARQHIRKLLEQKRKRFCQQAGEAVAGDVLSPASPGKFPF